MKNFENLLTPADKAFLKQLFTEHSLEVTNKIVAELSSFGFEQAPEKYLTRDEAAAKIRVSLPTLDKRIEDGLPVRRNGKKILFTEREIDEFLRRNRTG